LDSFAHTGESLAGIYQRHADTVYRICYLYFRNTADTEDAVQSVFLKLLRSPAVFESPEREKAWLIITAKNHCKNSLKHWWRTRRTEWPEGWEPAYNAPEPPAGRVDGHLLALPEKYRTVLYLYYYEEYKVKEISAMLNIGESTIRTRLARAREKLKIDLGGAYLE